MIVYVLMDRFKNGGVEVMVMEYIKLLDVKPTLLCLENVDTKYEYNNDIFNEVVEFNIKSFFGLFRVIAHILRNRPILIISAMTKSNVISSILAFFPLNISVITSVHGPVLVNKSRKEKIAKYILYRIIVQSDSVFCVSIRIRDELLELIGRRFSDKVIHLPNWFSSKSDVKSDAVQVVFSGRLEHDKGPIRALNIFLKSNISKDIPMLFYGTGSLKSELDRLVLNCVSERMVEMKGFDNNWTESLGENTVFFTTAVNEAFGIVVFEALSKGATVVIPGHLMQEIPVSIRNSGFVFCYFNDEEAIEALSCAVNRSSRDVSTVIEGEHSRSKNMLKSVLVKYS